MEIGVSRKHTRRPILVSVTNLTTGQYESRSVRSRAEANRVAQADRVAITAKLGYPVDCCATTGEMVQELRNLHTYGKRFL